MVSKIALEDEEFQAFQKLLLTKCGVFLGEDKKYLIETRLFDLVQTFQGSYKKLLEEVEKKTNRINLQDQILHLLTTHETYWFRDTFFWDTLKLELVPNLISLAQKGGTVSIWCAGCSTGQEPYSLAMLIDELCLKTSNKLFASHFKIIASDFSQEVLNKASLAQYNRFEMFRGLSLERRESYFQKSENDTWILNRNIRDRVKFIPLNLMDNFCPVLDSFHLILCRNVLVYFSSELKEKTLEKLVRTLNPNGFLILGASEVLTSFPKDLIKQDFKGTKYFEKK